MLQSVHAHLSQSEIRELIRAHYRMQLGGFLTRLDEHDHGLTVHSSVASSPLWNHTAWLEGSVAELEAFLARGRQQRGRRPVLYFVEAPAMDARAREVLDRAGYEPLDVESWMVRMDPEAAGPGEEGPLQVVRATTPREAADFIEVFNGAYQIHDPGYAQKLKQQILHAPAEPSIQHFIGYVEGRAACAGTLIEHERDACIYNVGTSPAMRGRGLAKFLMREIIREASRREIRRLFLQVLAGSGAERLYAGLGFQTLFQRAGFRLKSWTPDRPPPVSTPVPARTFLSAIQSPAEADEKREPIRLSVRLALRELASTLPATPEVLLTAAWAGVLSRYSGEEVVSFGVRRSDDFPDAPVALVSITVPEDCNTGEWMGLVESALKAEDLPEISPGHHESILSFHPVQRPGSGAAIELRFFETTLELSYGGKDFSRSALEPLLRHLDCFVQRLASHPDLPVREIDLLPESERCQLLAWSKPDHSQQTSATFPELFEARVDVEPARTALLLADAGSRKGELKWSYLELNQRVNQMAHYLRRLGVGPGVFVGICLERSMESIVSLLGVMKAGGVSVPLDPEYPEERLAFMVQDSRTSLVLTSQSLLTRVIGFGSQVICIDSTREAIQAETQGNPLHRPRGEEGAYVIYTSGSTGKPKGVLVPHRALAGHSVDMAAYYRLSPADAVLQFAPLNFDAALEQIFSPLLSGARVVLRGPEVWDARQLPGEMARHGVTVADLPTAYWHQLAREWAGAPEAPGAGRLRLVIVGGEAMIPTSVELWQRGPFRGARLINAYGPTETTITATCFDVDGNAARLPRVPIGRPRGQRTVYVLDRLARPVPVGVPGELCIGGEFLASGYLNRPELTREKFVPDPFRNRAKACMYRTGDQVRFLPDGTLEFLGRVDQQVKLRGFRIELEEVEAVLNRQRNVRESAAVLREDVPGEKRLVAYLVSHRSGQISIPEIRSRLQRVLPEYMVPASFVLLEALPLTPSGKIDRRALPVPEASPQMEQAAAPREPLELQLQLVFEKVLRRRPIGIDVSFFELGGDSLQALELIGGITKATGRTLPLSALYEASTIEGMASRIKEQEGEERWSSLVPLQPEGNRPPVFLVHTTPGDILGYGNLVHHLDPDQPVYGFQSLGLNRAELGHTRIEEMAAHYLRLLREVQPRGPYYLGGWCYGGIVAVEMARLICGEGGKVGFLGLMETIAPPPAFGARRYYMHRIGCLFRMPVSRWMRYFQHKLRYYKRVRVENQTRFQRVEADVFEDAAALERHNQMLERLEQVYDRNMQALHQYRTTPYSGRITLFNAEVLDDAVLPDPTGAWRGLVGEIEIHTVPGDHDSMLMEPHVRILAAKFDACLRRAQQEQQNPITRGEFPNA